MRAAGEFGGGDQPEGKKDGREANPKEVTNDLGKKRRRF